MRLALSFAVFECVVVPLLCFLVCILMLLAANLDVESDLILIAEVFHIDVSRLTTLRMDQFLHRVGASISVPIRIFTKAKSLLICLLLKRAHRLKFVKVLRMHLACGFGQP